jgi:hypothetical protein
MSPDYTKAKTSRSRGVRSLEETASSRHLVRFELLAIPFNRRHHRIQHILVAKRLGQEIDRPALQGPDGHRNVALACHEDDRNVNVRLS